MWEVAVRIRLDRLHCRYDRSFLPAGSYLSGGSEVANVCGKFGPNYTRRLCFGGLLHRGDSVARLVIDGLIPFERWHVRFG
jgi:hypothetical protein